VDFLAVATQETPFDDLELRFIVVMVQNEPKENFAANILN